MCRRGSSCACPWWPSNGPPSPGLAPGRTCLVRDVPWRSGAGCRQSPRPPSAVATPRRPRSACPRSGARGPARMDSGTGSGRPRPRVGAWCGGRRTRSAQVGATAAAHFAPPALTRWNDRAGRRASQRAPPGRRWLRARRRNAGAGDTTTCCKSRRAARDGRGAEPSPSPWCTDQTRGRLARASLTCSAGYS